MEPPYHYQSSGRRREGGVELAVEGVIGKGVIWCGLRAGSALRSVHEQKGKACWGGTNCSAVKL